MAKETPKKFEIKPEHILAAGVLATAGLNAYAEHKKHETEKLRIKQAELEAQKKKR